MQWDSSLDIDACHCESDKCCCCHNTSALDKENVHGFMGSPMKQESDISLYEDPSLNNDSATSRCVHHNKRRRPLEDVDHNSQDSGYGTSCTNDAGGRTFSPKRSFNSSYSMDDFLDICSLDDYDENAQLPRDVGKLITGSILPTRRESPHANQRRPNFRRAISMTTPTSSGVRSCLFSKHDEVRPFKRPEPPTPSPNQYTAKRYKTDSEKESNRIAAPLRLTRSISAYATEDSIKSALHRSSVEPDLIGDFTKQFCLPLTPGRHADLKSITPATLASLVTGNYDHSIASYTVVDCRFPYEYDGGHINGAINLYTKQQIMDELLNSKIKENTPVQEQENHRRHILVFHCEFSSERGPNLSRFLRQVDRSYNKDCYPYLHFPEIYLLDGGYKNFYEQFSELCMPDGYLPMLHPSYEGDLKYFRSKSKTFNNDNRLKSSSRSLSFKRM